jgi:hypothetical protein
MRRPGSEKPCEKVESIAGITRHPQSTSGALLAFAKRDDRLRSNKFQAWTKAGDRIRTGDVQLGKLTFYH